LSFVLLSLVIVGLLICCNKVQAYSCFAILFSSFDKKKMIFSLKKYLTILLVKINTNISCIFFFLRKKKIYKIERKIQRLK